MSKVIIDVVVGAVWLAACIFFITRIIEKKASRYVAVSILFILFTGFTAGSSIGNIIAQDKINEGGDYLLKEFLQKNYGNNPLIGEGYSTANVSKAVDEIESIVLSNVNQLGAKGFIAVEIYKIVGGKAFNEIRTKTDSIVSYADANGNGKINAETLIKFVKDQIFRIIDRIVLVIHLIVYLSMAIVLGRYFYLSMKKPEGSPQSAN